LDPALVAGRIGLDDSFRTLFRFFLVVIFAKHTFQNCIAAAESPQIYLNVSFFLNQSSHKDSPKAVYTLPRNKCGRRRDVLRCPVEAGCDPANLLDLVEEALDGVACFVVVLRETGRVFPIALAVTPACHPADARILG
jgi:hypothetical protein